MIRITSEGGKHRIETTLGENIPNVQHATIHLEATDWPIVELTIAAPMLKVECRKFVLQLVDPDTHEARRVKAVVFTDGTVRHYNTTKPEK